MKSGLHAENGVAAGYILLLKKIIKIYKVSQEIIQEASIPKRTRP